MNDNANTLDLEFTAPSWPQSGDKLFVPGFGRTVAYLGGFGTDFSRYAIGYKDAADALIEHTQEINSGADLQFYPIAFLYRQYLELRLKQLLISGGHVVYNKSKLTLGHDLKRPWAEVRKILESVWPDTYADEMDTLGKCIEELCQLDAKSISFRYPVDTDGQPTQLGLDRVDLVNLKGVMDRISSFLDASSDALGDILDNMPREEYYY
jgi:hypothetical protein